MSQWVQKVERRGWIILDRKIYREIATIEEEIRLPWFWSLWIGWKLHLRKTNKSQKGSNYQNDEFIGADQGGPGRTRAPRAPRAFRSIIL